MLLSSSAPEIILILFLFSSTRNQTRYLVATDLRCQMGKFWAQASSDLNPARYLVIAPDSSEQSSGWARIQTEQSVTDIMQITLHFFFISIKNPWDVNNWQIVVLIKYQIFPIPRIIFQKPTDTKPEILEYFLPIKRPDVPRRLLFFLKPLLKQPKQPWWSNVSLLILSSSQVSRIEMQIVWFCNNKMMCSTRSGEWSLCYNGLLW